MNSPRQWLREQLLERERVILEELQKRREGLWNQAFDVFPSAQEAEAVSQRQ